MDNSYCCVPGCNSLGSHRPRTSFHRFPREKDESSIRCRKEWIRLLKIGKKVSNRMVVCGKHFQPSDFLKRGDGPLACTKLRENALPSLKLPLSSCENRAVLNKRKEDSLMRLRRKEIRERSKQPAPINSTNILGDDTEGSDVDNLDFSNNDSGSIVDEEGINMAIAAEALITMSARTRDMGTQVTNDDFMDVNEPIMDVNEPVLTQDMGTQVTSGDLIAKRSFLTKITAPQIKLLTGITSTLLDTLVSLLETENKSITPRQMPLKHQVIMTLMKLKHGLAFSFLSVLFECTSTTCKNIFKEIIRHLAVHLKRAVPWQSKDAVMKRMPRCFRNYRKTRVVLNCTEVPITKPRCTKCRIMTYSQYKGGHTVKVMIGVAPSGTVTFLSPVYGGRASDKQIFEQSGIIEYLEPHEDAVMVDKGFHKIEYLEPHEDAVMVDKSFDKICANSFIDVIRPPFLKQKKQLSEQEATVTTKVARARVHVERMIQRIKMFKILKGKILWQLLPYVSDIFTVCSGLANLGNPILSADKF